MKPGWHEVCTQSCCCILMGLRKNIAAAYMRNPRAWSYIPEVFASCHQTNQWVETNQLLAECEVSSGDTNEFHAIPRHFTAQSLAIHLSLARGRALKPSAALRQMLLPAGCIICSLWPSLAGVHACVLKCFMDVFGPLLKNLHFLNSLADTLLSMCQIEEASLHVSTSGAETGKRWRCTGMKEWRRVIDLNESDW